MGVHLKATRCRLCGTIYHPPRAICHRCGPGSKGHLEMVELPDKGRIITYTILHYPPEGYSSPMILAMAEIGDVRLIGRVIDAEAVEEGCGVEVVGGNGEAPFLLRRIDVK